MRWPYLLLALVGSCTPPTLGAPRAVDETLLASDPTPLDQPTRTTEPTPAPTSETESSAGATDASVPAPAPARFESLEVPEFLDAVVSLPPGSGAEPVLVATHGAGGAPEHHCHAWRKLLGSRGIVLCPRGAMIDKRYGADAGFYYPNHHALEKELVAALASFEGAYRERLLEPGYTYAGYSQGATMGALVLPKHAAKFARAILVEGGFSEWDLRAAKAFKANGGVRVLFICGRRACQQAAQRSVAILERAHVEASSKYARGAGHTYLGPVADEIAAAFPWLVEKTPWLDPPK